MALNAKIISIVAATLLLLAFILYCVANGVPAWGKFNIGQTEYTRGLWRFRDSSPILTVSGPVNCPAQGDNNGVCSRILAARAFVTLACILSAVSVLCILISLVIKDKLRSLLLWSGKGLAIGCLIVGIIGVAIGVNVHTSKDYINYAWGASSIIGVIAIIINFAGAVATLLIR